MASTAKPCKATRADGQPCQGWAGTGSDYCFAHDPAQAEARKLARVKGGKARHGRSLATGGNGELATLASMEDVCRNLEQALRDVLGLENSIARARTVGYLCGMAVKALEMSDLEGRICQLEEQIGA